MCRRDGRSCINRVPLTGNKIDREDREIPTHVGEGFAQRHGMYFLETSAKEAENVERLFMEIAAELMEVIDRYIVRRDTLALEFGCGYIGISF